MTTYRVQRSRSHNVHSDPQGWETVFSGDEAAAVQEYRERRSALGCSGDQLRIIDETGVDATLELDYASAR